MHTFTCNICNSACRAEVLDREIPSCNACGSSVRFRWIVHALSLELFGKSLPLNKFPKRKALHGLGLSDPLSIAEVLSQRFDYSNTCFDREPRFDIMSPPPPAQCGFFDFIIASEVCEHVVPPIQTAFNNLARLLKPGGFVIFSSPSGFEGDTLEHFPNLHDWQVAKLQSGYVLVNRTREGRLEVFEDPVFHGGPGSTLEMRIFSESGLLACCEGAGLARGSFAADYPPLGIVWEAWSRGLVIRKPPTVK